MAQLDRRLRMRASLPGAHDRSGRRSREKECLSNRNTRVLVDNKDIPASCRLLRPNRLPPRFGLPWARRHERPPTLMYKFE